MIFFFPFGMGWGKNFEVQDSSHDSRLIVQYFTGQLTVPLFDGVKNIHLLSTTDRALKENTDMLFIHLHIAHAFVGNF